MQIELQTLRPVPFSQRHGSLPTLGPALGAELAVTRQAFCLRSHHHVKGKPPFWLSVLLDPRCGSTRFHLGSGALSRLRSASTMLSNPTGCFAPGGSRRAGCDSTAQASDAQDDRIARFSSVVRSGSLTTSCGWSNSGPGAQRVRITPRGEIVGISARPTLENVGASSSPSNPPAPPPQRELKGAASLHLNCARLGFLHFRQHQ
jgi:hypothetical protein